MLMFLAIKKVFIGYLLEVNNGLIICWNKLSTNGYVQNLKLPITFTKFIIGTVTTYKNRPANTSDGAEGYYVVNLSTIHVASGSILFPATYIMLGV